MTVKDWRAVPEEQGDETQGEPTDEPENQGDDQSAGSGIGSWE
jgi:hypothetical protein